MEPLIVLIAAICGVLSLGFFHSFVLNSSLQLRILKSERVGNPKRKPGILTAGFGAFIGVFIGLLLLIQPHTWLRWFVIPVSTIGVPLVVSTLACTAYYVPDLLTKLFNAVCSKAANLASRANRPALRSADRG